MDGNTLSHPRWPLASVCPGSLGESAQAVPSLFRCLGSSEPMLCCWGNVVVSSSLDMNTLVSNQNCCDYVLTWREEEVPRLLRHTEGSSPGFSTSELANEVNN